MKRLLLRTLICSSLFAWAATSPAQDEVTVFGNAPAHALSADEAAISACFTAFINQLVPGSTPRVRVVVRPGDEVFSVSSQPQRMDVTMTANARKDGKLLASSRCTVTRSAKVVDLRTQWRQPATLAGLSLRDIAVRSTTRQ